MKKISRVLPVWVALVAGCWSLISPAAQADEPADAALKAEIEVLKNRLSNLERQVAQGGGEFKGISGIGEKPVAGLLELPSGLQGLQISGYADVSAIYNFSAPEGVTSNTTAPPTTTRTNRGRVFDLQSNGFTIQATELVLEKPVSSEMPIGFRTDLFFGDDAEVIHSTGLGDVASGDNPVPFDLQQAYAVLRAPVGDGLDFKIGKFVTLLGAEVIESPANWNFSRSYLFGFAIPFTHTGVLATYPLGEFGSVTAGLVNGWDIVDDNNKAKTLIGNLTLTPVQGVSLAFNGITGAEQASNSHDRRTVFDFVGTWQALENLAFMANYDYGVESAGAATSYDAKDWTGLALYTKYDVTPIWSLVGRWEWFDDHDDFRTGLTSGVTSGAGSFTPHPVKLYGYTLTSQWKLREHVLGRLEYRHDTSSERVFLTRGSLSNAQDTVSAEVIYHF